MQIGGKRCLTISRQMGSLGLEIATTMGEYLGYRVFSREIINQAARRAGAPEAALAAIDELGLLGFCPSPEACQAYRLAVEQVMNELVSEGDVIIVGRAGQIILAGKPNVFHVRVIAPKQVRIQRLVELDKLSVSAAAARITASDRFRKNYLIRFYQVEWEDPTLYDLIINTARLQTDQAVELICHAFDLATRDKIETVS